MDGSPTLRSRHGAAATMLVAVLAAGCSCHQTQTAWPVPVPYATDGLGNQWRLELSLPLSGGCAVLTRATFLANKGACPDLERLDGFVRARRAALNRFTLKRDHRNRATCPAIMFG